MYKNNHIYKITDPHDEFVYVTVTEKRKLWAGGVFLGKGQKIFYSTTLEAALRKDYDCWDWFDRETGTVGSRESSEYQLNAELVSKNSNSNNNKILPIGFWEL